MSAQFNHFECTV